jgi:hypothetical protein
MSACSPQMRIESLVQAARRLASPHTRCGRLLRSRLLDTTGLSPEGIDLGLREHLETNPTERDIAKLLSCATPSAHVHVVLSSNVFTAPLRALALACAGSERVTVRPSSRDPAFVEALVEQLDAEPVRRSIDWSDALAPSAGEEVHLYGSDETMREVCAELSPDVRVRAHGTGMGIAIIGSRIECDLAAQKVATDMVPFDQRGCLSPRVAIVQGDLDRATQFAVALGKQLVQWASRVPLGLQSGPERAQSTRYRDTARLLGDLITTESSMIGVQSRPTALYIPPPGRHLGVVAFDDPSEAAAAVAAVARKVAAIGVAGDETGWAQTALGGCWQAARRSDLGRMQRPAFDGPVDLRHPGLQTPAQVLARLGVGGGGGSGASLTGRETGR